VRLWLALWIACVAMAQESRVDWEQEIELGNSYRASGDLGTAIQHLERVMARPEVKAEPLLYARAALHLGMSYIVHGNSERGFALLDEAITTYEQNGNKQAAARTAQTKAMMLTARGDRALALEALRLTAVNEPTGELTIPVLYELVASGQYLRAVAEMEAAIKGPPRRLPPSAYWLLSSAYFHLQRYEDAEQAAATGIEYSNRLGNATASGLAYFWRGKALDKLGRIREASEDVLSAVRVQENIRGSLLSEDSWKRAFGDRREPALNTVLDIVWRAGREREALEVVEVLRARAFMDLVANNQITPPDTAVKLMERTRRYGSPVISYWVHPDAVFLWVVNPEGQIHGVRTAIPSASLAKLIARASSLSAKPDRQAWRALHQILIQPALPYLSRTSGSLTILPHGPLLDLPFAALMNDRGRYLVEDFAVRTVPASMFIDKESASSGTGRYLLIGAPVRMGKLPALPGAERELRMLASSVNASSTLLNGKLAKSERAIEEMPSSRTVHFATHAVVTPASPMDSYLALSDGEKLSMNEIYKLKLQADLVFLSACRSGSGKVSSDGIYGFTRAFLGAGASTVIAPLWDVPDEPTSAMMVEFYRLYSRGTTKGEALRQAQLKLLRELRAGRVQVTTPAGPAVLSEHPHLWAGFVSQGAD